jgi:hypothetical protein
MIGQKRRVDGNFSLGLEALAAGFFETVHRKPALSTRHVRQNRWSDS